MEPHSTKGPWYSYNSLSSCARVDSYPRYYVLIYLTLLAFLKVGIVVTLPPSTPGTGHRERQTRDNYQIQP